MPQPHPIVPQHAGTVRPRNGAHAGHAETTHAPPDDPDDELPPELLDELLPVSSASSASSPAAAQAPNIPKPTINKPLTTARPYEYILPVYMLNLAGQRPTGPKAGSGDAHGTREGA